MTTLPYNEIFVKLLVQIHRAIGYCYVKYDNGKGELLETDEELNAIYKPVETYFRAGVNSHLTKGLTDSDQNKFRIFPRLSKLTIQAFLNIQENKSTSSKAEVLPSPLNILYYALTIPDEPQTSAYPFILCRSMLFYFLGIHPRHPDLNKHLNHFEVFTEEDVLNSITSFNNYNQIQARWPDPRWKKESLNTKVHFLNGYILSLKGITHLWFNKNEKKNIDSFFNIPKGKESLQYLKDLYCSALCHFRLSSNYVQLPDSSEVINWIFGLTLPIKGADVLFYGGLKKSSSAGLVISLQGQPGTGKTSTALSFAAALAPFNTQTVYLSLEEEIDDLETRLHTLIPEYLKGLSIYKRRRDDRHIDWFTPRKIRSNINLEELTEILGKLKKDLYHHKPISDSDGHYVRFPAVCPLLIVIDNINELFTGKEFSNSDYGQLEKFIERCRNMGAIVMLIAAEEIPKAIKLDYLVDVSMYLKQVNVELQAEKPIRLLQLVKTRHQISRQGSHVFHISNSKGFRISPQVPSQMDKREKVKVLLPSDEKCLETLNIHYNKEGGVSYNNYLKVADRSHILVHGYGSSGKAGFSLKLLCSPSIKNDRAPLTNPGSEKRKKEGYIFSLDRPSKNKVLIISFLYPVEYYDSLIKKIKNQLSETYEGYDERYLSYHVAAFYPGFLTPEDFVYKIVRMLDEARLEGEPYTGILLDGLHNVFLQFKNLQEAHMVWPLLYSILSRYNFTVVTTFTNFSLENETAKKRYSSPSPDEYNLMQQGQKPFLHGLVKAADYYFFLEEIIDEKNSYKRDYWLSVRSSIRQLPPNDFLSWDRNDLRFTRRIPADEVYGNREAHSNER